MPVPASVAALALGWTAGMRSASAPALLAHTLASGRPPRRNPARLLAAPAPRRLLALAAGGEMIADKLPFIPARTTLMPLLGRAASGALVGTAVAAARRSDPLVGVLAGVVGAVAGSFVMEAARREVGVRLDLPDPMVAVVEDGLTLALGTAAARAAADG